MPRNVITQDAIVGLIRAGVGMEEAHRILQVAEEDDRLTLMVLPKAAVPGEPRVGDKLRGHPIIAMARSRTGWAVVLEPPGDEGGDDLTLIASPPRGYV